MQDYAIIEYSNVPGHLPTSSFVEKIFLPTGNFRIKRTGTVEEKLMTEEKFETTISDISRQHLIRSTCYDRYQVSIAVNEFQNIQLLSAAGKVTIYLEDGTRHDAIITEFSEPEKVPGSDYSIIKFTYFDTNTQNYIAGCVNDILTSAAVIENYEPGELHKIRVKTKGSQIEIYTILEAEKFVAELQETGENLNGLLKNSRVIIQTGYKLRFYVTELEMISLKIRLAKFTPDVSDEIKLTMSGSGTNYFAVERIIPEIEKIDTDLYKVDLSLKYLSETFNNYQ